jgi:methyl-accepting chemotaxis protein
VGLTGLAVSRINALADGEAELYHEMVLPLVSLDSMTNDFLIGRAKYNLYARADEKIRTELKPALAESWASTEKVLADYEPHASNAQNYAALKNLFTRYFDVIDDQLVPAADSGDIEQATAVLQGPFREAADAVADELEAATGRKAVAASVEAEDGAGSAHSAILLLWVALGLGVTAAGALALLVVRQITRTVRSVQRSVEALSAGDLTVFPRVSCRDEVARMAAALDTALGRLSTTMTSIGDNATTLASASEELTSVSSGMSGSASESASQATMVAAAAEQVSRNVQTVAAGTEQMSASIHEIAQNSSNAAAVARQAVQVAESTNASVTKLGDSSAEVGNVIKVINSIADQTNLLALNATIEAARAGEAGKGFAVVAGEVKELAQETAKATEDIGRRIEAIQTDTGAAIAAITEISRIIAEINDTQSTIAAAVEEQTATTNEITRNVAEAATGATEIATTITGVADSATATTTAATSTTEAADELARMATELRTLVGQFRY